MTGSEINIEYFSGSMEESTISSSSLDMDRLKDLLKNPGKYLLSYLRENPQLATSFTIPLGTFNIVSHVITFYINFWRPIKRHIMTSTKVVRLRQLQTTAKFFQENTHWSAK